MTCPSHTYQLLSPKHSGVILDISFLIFNQHHASSSSETAWIWPILWIISMPSSTAITYFSPCLYSCLCSQQIIFVFTQQPEQAFPDWKAPSPALQGCPPRVIRPNETWPGFFCDPKSYYSLPCLLPSSDSGLSCSSTRPLLFPTQGFWIPYATARNVLSKSSHNHYFLITQNSVPIPLYKKG